MSEKAAEPPGAECTSILAPQIAPLASSQAKVDALQAELEQSTRYHQGRSRFYGRLHNITVLAVFVLGWTAFDALGGNATALFGFGVAVLGALGLVLYCSHWGEDHEELLRRYERLAAEVRTEEQPLAYLRIWSRQQRQIAAREPPIRWALKAACRKPVLQARATKQPRYKISLLPRLLMNFFKFDRASFSMRGSRK
jgi:hypothetical protein